jgi:anti-anti-sigma factor
VSPSVIQSQIPWIPVKPLEISLQPHDPPVALIRLAGFLDAHTVSMFDKDLERYLDEGRHRVVLDIGELSYISSAGIGAMMGLAQRLRKKGGILVLLRPSEKVFKILDTLGFTKIFQITNDADEALRAVEVAS